MHMVIGGAGQAQPLPPPDLAAPTDESGQATSQAQQAAALKIFKQANEAEPRAAMDLLAKTLATGVGGKLNVVA
ncbi:MAG: hypothetical protein ACE366_13425 [Bradymonadia bacterium]